MTTRTLPWDWYGGSIPASVSIDDTAYIETAFSFFFYRSEQAEGVSIGRGSSTYLGTMFDVGPRGRVRIGAYTLLHGAWVVCDAAVTIDDYVFVSWNVVLMDSYRVAIDPMARRQALVRAASYTPRRVDGDAEARPIHVGRSAWIGFDSCILPGVSIGEGAIVGARSVVREDVEPFTIVAGNPARVVRTIERSQ